MTTTKQQPEALATFAEASRSDGKKPDELGLAADKGTQPIPTSPDLKNEAATRVLQEGVEHKDKGSRELIDELPDRIVESRDGTHGSANADPTEVQGIDTRDGLEGQGDKR